MEIKVEMLPNSRIQWFEKFLEENNFTTELQSYMASLIKPNSSDKAKAMVNELTGFVEANQRIVVAKVACLLSACKEMTKPQYVVPMLRWIELDVAFPENGMSRMKQLVNFILSTLHKLHWMGTSNTTGDLLTRIECPEIDTDYPAPPATEILYEDVTGKYLAKLASHGLDHNMDAMHYISRVELKITDSWKDNPVMIEPADPAKLSAFEAYAGKLAPSVNKAAAMDSFNIPYRQDCRYRCYAACDSVNITGNKQIRSCIELANKEIIKFDMPEIACDDNDIPEL